MKFILLINVKMPTIVGILTFIGQINTGSECFKQEKLLLQSILLSMSTVEISRYAELSMNKVL